MQDYIWILVIVVLAIVIVIPNIKIVPQATAFVMERLGAYTTTWQVGMHWKVPFIERVARRVYL